MIIFVGIDGEIILPIEIRKLFSKYVSFSISRGNIKARLPVFKDNWTNI